ncbi:MAG: hypothetical protein R3C49_23770 [Planctomycetaceae bacterium]
MLDSRLMQHVGRVSYGIYIYHIPVAVLVGAWIVDPIWLNIPFEEFGVLARLRWHSWILKFPLFTGLSVLMATASYNWFEKPILARKDVWFPSRDARVESA